MGVAYFKVRIKKVVVHKHKIEKMSFLRSWRQLPRTLRRGRRASNNVPEPEGPEMPRGFLFNEKVRCNAFNIYSI